MAAPSHRFRPILRWLSASGLSAFLLFALAQSPAIRSRAQSAPAQQQDAATPAPQPASSPATPPAAATPTEPRPPYPGMTPEEKRKQEVAAECADLLKLATDLKAQVDKTGKDELSVTVVRKASELEQMARKVRNGTALTADNQKDQQPAESKP